MSIFKKSDEGFLTRLFKHKQVDELAEKLASTYAEEMQEDMLSDSGNDVKSEQIEMLEVTDSGTIDFQNTDTAQDGSPPLQDSPSAIIDSKSNSNVRNHIITFRVNDAELAAIDKRFKETTFRSRGDFCRYSALTVMNVEQDDESIKQIAKYIRLNSHIRS